ncbi:hypothetical protein QNO07_09445 [Streptomyces sp. 549]|uniref:DUF6197 family protein n=1 Tax=Streptomyces sp. 549 TaxID=3049076 RepID=UPI0024C2A6A7|nr:hypothetical protein [Streptomyces sp. 549]MDK1473643.1 hypothetical protein [Streptomyces sp. 549]
MTATVLDLSPADVARLHEEIGQYLAQQGTPTAHRLVTRTTADLVAEALASVPAPAPVLDVPPSYLRWLPDRVWRTAGHARAVRPVSVPEYLALTARVLERHGWTQGAYRTRSGRRCIAGDFQLLHWLGYGDEATADGAARAVAVVLASRGVTVPFAEWQDRSGIRREHVLNVLNDAQAVAS